MNHKYILWSNLFAFKIVVKYASSKQVKYYTNPKDENLF